MSDSNDLHDAGVTERAERMRATRAVTRYLDSLSGQPRVAKPATTRTVETELAKLDERLAKPALGSARRLKLLQDRRNLLTHGVSARGRSRSRSGDNPLDGFITHAASYAADHQISYEAFLDFGVPAEVLDKAHIPHSSDESETDAPTAWPPRPQAEPRFPTSGGGERVAIHAMRGWLQENGYEVADRGRIPQNMQDAYHRANDQTTS